MTPSERVTAVCARWDEPEVVRGCALLLGSAPQAVTAGPELELAVVLGGLADPAWLASGPDESHRYWARVWAARALPSVSGEVVTECRAERDIS